MKNLAGIVLVFILSLSALRMTGSLEAVDTHPVDSDCRDCHLAKTTIDKSNAGILVADQEALCGGCHKNALTASHPSGIKPGSPIPPEFPLDWKGDMTCSTCHDVHASDPVKLRVNRQGKALCQSCHDQEFFARMKDGGSSIMNFGHLDARASLIGDIDNFSIQCMACHELLAGDLQVRATGRVIRHNGNRVNHPVGMSYADSVSFGGYRPEARLKGAIRLPDGKVSCISCHSGYSELHGKLVIDNQKDELCFSCHDL